MPNKYSKQQLRRILVRDIDKEFRTVRTYLQNVEQLNYGKNKKKIDILILDSLMHATWLTKQVLAMQDPSSAPLDKIAWAAVAQEEVALHDIYAFEMERTDDAAVRALFAKLMAAELMHEKLVKTLN